MTAEKQRAPTSSSKQQKDAISDHIKEFLKEEEERGGGSSAPKWLLKIIFICI